MLTTSYAHGAPNWVELSGSPDVVDFYRQLFGWRAEKGRFLLGEEGEGGEGKEGGEGGETVAAFSGAEGPSAYWRLSFRTASSTLDVAKAVESGGGTAEFVNHDFGHFRDPAGFRFGVRRGGLVPALDAVDVPGALWWTQLYVSGAEEPANEAADEAGAGAAAGTTTSTAAKRFYLSVFGWDAQDIVLERGAEYTVLSPAGSGIAGAHGGIIRLPPADPAGAQPVPGWVPYFRVADCDAAVADAVSLGAAVVYPPESAAGIGRQATLLDPGRGQFAVNQVA